jgi:RNA polymerase sigma-70 factor (sigma-E family)
VSTSPATSPAAAGAFEDFFREAWPWAFRLATFLVHDAAAGEDIAQSALAKLSERWGGAERPAAYLRTSIVHGASNWQRHRRIVGVKLPLLVDAVPAEAGFDELADAIARLPFRQRAVVVLRYYCDLSEAEIATALDCRPGTVKSLASRALTTLAKEIRS